MKHNLYVVTVLVYAVGGYWIITYVKKYGNTAYFNVLFGTWK